MRRIVALFLLLLAGCAGSVDPSKYTELVVVSTNDVHGYIRPMESKLGQESVVAGGAEWFAGYVHILEKKYGDRLILLDGGDLFQGTLDSNPFQGESVIKVYNELPYRAAAIGNHEFDYGPLKNGGKDRRGALKARMREAKFPFLSANTYYRGTEKVWREYNLYPSVQFTAGGVKVGVLGLTTETTGAKTSPLNTKDLEFGDLVSAAEREAKKLRAQGATVVIITMHEGDLPDHLALTEMLKRMRKGLVDAIVSGHTHRRVATTIEGYPVIQAGYRGLYFARMDLFVDKATGEVNPDLTQIHEPYPVCAAWFHDEDSCDTKDIENPAPHLPLRPAVYEGEVVKPDLKVREILAPYFKQADKLRGEVLGHVNSWFGPHPSGENDIGQLFMAAFHRRYPDAKVIYINGGSFRRYFAPGPITYGDLYEVNPFDNFVTKVTMTGKDLKKLLRVGFSGAHSTPQLSGLQITYSKTGPKTDINGDGKIELWELDRVQSVTWDNGAPVKDEEKILLITSDYLVEGGDNMDQVFLSIPTTQKVLDDIIQRDVVAEFLRKNPTVSLPVPYKPHIHVIQ